jgi:signal transduction histidine kinase
VQTLPLWPVDRTGVEARLRLVPAAAAQTALAVPAIPLAVLTVVGWATAPLLVGLVLLAVAVPGTRLVTGAYRSLAGRLLGEQIPESYQPTRGLPALSVVWTWLRDPARWRDLGHLAFASTGGVVMSGALVLPLAAVALYLSMPFWVSGMWGLMVLLVPAWAAVWWVVGVPVLAARLRVDRFLLGPRTSDVLRERVEEVTTSRAETVDHSTAELRRLERDLHDGPQAQLASLGMSIGLAEQLLSTDPEQAARLLAEAKAVTVTALDDLRSVVRGIHPPALADRGLVGGVEALAVQLAVPVTIAADLPGRPPAPVESAGYFAVAECLANAVKHARASRVTITVSHDGRALRLVVRDDGLGGATVLPGGGLDGVARRLRAFDGSMDLDSPEGGPTTVSLEIPCALSSPRTTPSSARD